MTLEGNKGIWLQQQQQHCRLMVALITEYTCADMSCSVAETPGEAMENSIKTLSQSVIQGNTRFFQVTASHRRRLRRMSSPIPQLQTWISHFLLCVRWCEVTFMQAIKEQESQAERLTSARRRYSHQKCAMLNKDYATGPAVLFFIYLFFLAFSTPADVTASLWASGIATRVSNWRHPASACWLLCKTSLMRRIIALLKHFSCSKCRDQLRSHAVNKMRLSVGCFLLFIEDRMLWNILSNCRWDGHTSLEFVLCGICHLPWFWSFLQ